MIDTYRVEIEGLTPLLLHADNIEWADEMEAWRADPNNKKMSKAGDDRTPAYRWIGCLYHDGEQVCMASENIARCLMEGGAMVPVPGGRSGKTFKAQTQSGMKIDDLSVPLMVGDGELVSWKDIEKLRDKSDFLEHTKAAESMGFSLFVKRAKVGQSKHIRVRPKFDTWALSFLISVWDEQLKPAVLETILSFAGSHKGLGDWRPGGKTPGPYGMFKLTGLGKV